MNQEFMSLIENIKSSDTKRVDTADMEKFWDPEKPEKPEEKEWEELQKDIQKETCPGIGTCPGTCPGGCREETFIEEIDTLRKDFNKLAISQSGSESGSGSGSGSKNWDDVCDGIEVSTDSKSLVRKERKRSSENPALELFLYISQWDSFVPSINYFIVLDVDGTLITSIPWVDDHPPDESPIMMSKYEYVDYAPFFRIFLRPGLRRFLRLLTSKYKVGIWSDSSWNYLTWIMNHIINPNSVNENIVFAWWNDFCSMSQAMYGRRKDLRIIKEKFMISIDAIKIIENNDLLLHECPDNLILVDTFDPLNCHDNEFTWVLDDLWSERSL